MGGIATATGVAEPDCYTARTEKKAFKPITINTKFTCKLRDYLEEVEGRSFSDVEAKPHREGRTRVKREKPDRLVPHQLLAQSAHPLWPPLQTHLQDSSFALEVLSKSP